jgi:2-iminoacetate synthase
MKLCKSGDIRNVCHPNALMTLQEYLLDYAGAETRAIGEKLIEDDEISGKIRKNLEAIKNGERDFKI